MHGTTIASPLSRKATLVALTISVWTARKLDRKITDETNKRHHAKADAGRYNKLLIKAERLAEINEIASAARELHYRKTKPWGDHGQGILPNTLYVEYTSEFRRLKQRFNEAADVFARNFPAYVAERKAELNGMFRADDYPSASEIRAKFNMELNFSNLPDADDFRSDVLDADTIADIREEIGRTVEHAEREAMTHTYRQIAEVVGHMVTKLGEYKAEANGPRRFFFPSLVDNIRNLVELLPAFNLTGDKRLDDLAARISKELCAEDAKALRENDDLREGVLKSAEEILADVERIMA